MAEARSALGEAAFATAYAEGGTVALEDALAEVCAWLVKDVPAGYGAR